MASGDACKFHQTGLGDIENDLMKYPRKMEKGDDWTRITSIASANDVRGLISLTALCCVVGQTSGPHDLMHYAGPLYDVY